MASLYLIPNGPSPTTAAQVAVTTGTAIKTMLQVKPLNVCRVIEWGISFDGSAAATPIDCELLTTGTVFATVTAHVAAGIVDFGSGLVQAAPATNFTLSTSGTGYTGSAEGSITVSRMLDVQHIAPTSQYVKQFPLGREPVVDPSDILRIRVTAAAAVNAYCYVIVEV